MSTLLRSLPQVTIHYSDADDLNAAKACIKAMYLLELPDDDHLASEHTSSAKMMTQVHGARDCTARS